MKNIFLILCSIYTSLNFACLNEFYGIDKNGEFHENEYKDIEIQIGSGYFFTQNFDLKSIQLELKKTELILKKNQDYQVLSDYSVLLLKGGEVEKALKIFKVLAHYYPTEYQIIANLGTAYELNGQIDSALFYIKKGIELNPNSHGGSEWVHIRILETKQQLTKDSLYLSTHTVLNLSEQERKDSLIRQQLFIQLQERIPFCPAPNKIIGNLLIDLGNYYETYSLEYAKAIYTLAYEVYQEEQGQVKMKEVDLLIKKYKTKYPKRGGRGAKIEKISLAELYLNQNRDNYDIDWNTLNTNVELLLSYANLQKIELPNITEKSDSMMQDTVYKKTICSLPVENEADETKKVFKAIMVYAIIFSIVLFIIAIFINKKRNENKTNNRHYHE